MGIGDHTYGKWPELTMLLLPTEGCSAIAFYIFQKQFNSLTDFPGRKMHPKTRTHHHLAARVVPRLDIGLLISPTVQRAARLLVF